MVPSLLIFKRFPHHTSEELTFSWGTGRSSSVVQPGGSILGARALWRSQKRTAPAPEGSVLSEVFDIGENAVPSVGCLVKWNYTSSWTFCC